MILLNDNTEVACNKPSCPVKDTCIHFSSIIEQNVWYKFFGLTGESCEHYKTK